MIIWIASYPKSGNTWIRSLINQILFTNPNNKEKIFREIIHFINNLKQEKNNINELKFFNAVKSTNFVNLKNKEKNEKFDESVYSKKGKKINFFNLGFKNKWQKSLPEDMISKINSSLKKELLELNYI